jgi:hypothetical protein
VIEMNYSNGRRRLDAAKKIARILGIFMAAPFFIWLLVGFIPAIPSIIDVFGMQGLRLPTGVVIAGLMLAAFGFEDF